MESPGRDLLRRATSSVAPVANPVITPVSAGVASSVATTNRRIVLVANVA